MRRSELSVILNTMEEEWTIKLTRDEGLVLFDFLQRWEETDADLGFVDSAEQAAVVRLSGYLETAEGLDAI